MIERLQQVLTWLEQLLPEVQEEAAAQLEALAEPFEEIPIKKLLLQSSPVKQV